MVEEYDFRFMELVKYVSYMDNDQCSIDRFIQGLNPKIMEMVHMNPNIRGMVDMSKPSLVAEIVEHVHYVEENFYLNGGNKTIFPQKPRFMGKAPRPFPRGEFEATAIWKQGCTQSTDSGDFSGY